MTPNAKRVYNEVRRALRASRNAIPAAHSGGGTTLRGLDVGEDLRRRLPAGLDAASVSAAVAGQLGETSTRPSYRAASNTTNTRQFLVGAEDQSLVCVMGNYTVGGGLVESQGGGVGPELLFLWAAGSAAIKTGTVRVYLGNNEGSGGVVVRATHTVLGLTGILVAFNPGMGNVDIWRFVDGVQNKMDEQPTVMAGSPTDYIEVEMALGSFTVYTAASEIIGTYSTAATNASGRVGFASEQGLTWFTRFEVNNLSE